MTVVRTWTLVTECYAYTDDSHWRGPDIAEGEQVETIELEPVLALLERLRLDVGMQESFQECWKDGTIETVGRLLRAHGREIT